MDTMANRNRRLKVFVPIGLFLLMLSVLAWLVNLDLAVRAVWLKGTWLGVLLPTGLYRFFEPLAVDFSTVSTLVAVLLLFYPLVQAVRILRDGGHDPSVVHRFGGDPYPSHFGFFLVMLGLEGTLYGLLIGLSTSGVTQMTGGATSAGAIQATLKRLLDGTATALWSSLVGIIGAFLAARPIPLLFRWLACVEDDEAQKTLSETLQGLTRDLHGLSEASRGFSAQLRVEAFAELFKRLDVIASSARATETRIDTSNDRLLRMETAQGETNRLLQRLETMEASVNGMADGLNHCNDGLQRLIDTQERIADLLRRQEADGTIQRQAILKELAAMSEATRETGRGLRDDREAVRHALSLYVKRHDADASAE